MLHSSTQKIESTEKKGLGSDGHGFSKKQLLAGVFLLIFPFLILYWMVPFVSGSTIGNDYLVYWIEMQMGLKFSLEHGTFPLYVPGFNGGWTSSALTLGQLYHPISWLAALIPGYWNGHAHEINTFLRLLSLGAVHAALFFFLLKLRLKSSLAFIFSFIAVYNMRMLDMFRYGASLENYTACLLLYASVGWCWFNPFGKFRYIAVTLCTWLLIVGGHPQIAYIGLIGGAFIYAITPFYIARLLPDEYSVSRYKLRSFYLKTALAVVLGILLACCYIFPFYFEYVRESSRNLGGDFIWSCGSQDSITGALHNFFNPFYSEVHGAFGGSIFFMTAILTPLLFFIRLKIPRSILLLWMLCIIIFFLSTGSNGFLFYYFWKYFPFSQTFREPGRLGLALPYFLMLILVWLSKLKSCEFKVAGIKLGVNPFALLLIITIILFISLRILYSGSSFEKGRYYPAQFNAITMLVAMTWLACGVTAVLTCFLYLILKHFKYILCAIFLCTAILQTTLTLRYGTWLYNGARKTRTFQEYSAVQKGRLAYRTHTGDLSMALVEEHLNKTFLEPFLVRICPRYTAVDSRDKAYENLLREREVDHVYVEGFTAASHNTQIPATGTHRMDIADLIYISYNNLKCKVRCAQPSFFVLSYPFSKRWQSYVDGVRVPVYRCNAIENGIFLQSGVYTVEFRYFSIPAIVGVAITYLAAIFLAISLLVQINNRSLKWSLIAVAICILTLTVLAWYRSLYNGKNIGTSYLWTSEQITPNLSSQVNLAYGKTTKMILEGPLKSNLVHGSKGVDGNRSIAFGFVSSYADRAWWEVDLNKPTVIGEIVLFERHTNHFHPTVPYDILVSNDANNWIKIGTIDKISKDKPQIIDAKGLTARYIRLETCGPGVLSFCEVEVYPTVKR